MATKGRRRRGRRSKKIVEVEEGPTTWHDLPDHLQELILLRVDTSLWLARATAVCWRWYRLVADPRFLAKFASLHPPHIIGEYSNIAGWPLFVPSSPVAALLGLRFSLDFLPDYDGGSWDVADSRGSLLLLSNNKCCCRYYYEKPRCTRYRRSCICSNDLIVCEPLTQRYQGILLPRKLYHGGVFLVDGADADRRIGMSNFRVMAAPSHEDAWVFSSACDGHWRKVSRNADVELPDFSGAIFVGRANGAIYWGVKGGATAGLLLLDETTAESSHVVFPENVWGAFDGGKRPPCRVIGGGDGALRVVRLRSNELNVFVRRPAANDGDEWLLEKHLNLPAATAGLPGREETFFKEEAMLVSANARYVLVQPREKKSWVFTVELDTMTVEREHERNRYAKVSYPYELPWQPAFGLDRAGRRRRERKGSMLI